MARIIRWLPHTWCHSASGDIHCTGIEALPLKAQLGPNCDRSDVVVLSAINKFGMVARCSIDVPVANLPELIAELQKYVIG